MNTATTTLLTALITAGFTWLLSRSKTKAEEKKIKAEVSALEIKNAEAMVNFWKEMTQDLRKEIHELSLKLEKALSENAALRKDMARLEKQLKQTKIS